MLITCWRTTLQQKAVILCSGLRPTVPVASCALGRVCLPMSLLLNKNCSVAVSTMPLTAVRLATLLFHSVPETLLQGRRQSCAPGRVGRKRKWQSV